MQARFVSAAPTDRSGAIKLCEDMYYNLRRVWGALDPKTLEVEELLSQLYTHVGHYREAMGVHEEVLRRVVEGDDGDDRTMDNVAPEIAKKHLDLLKRSFLRLKGWDKSDSMYRDLVHQLLEMKEYKGTTDFKGVQGVDKWNIKEPVDSMGLFVPPKNWEYAEPKSMAEAGQVIKTVHGERSKMGIKRATSNWGIGLRDYSNGHSQKSHTDHNRNGFQNGIGFQNDHGHPVET